MDQINETPEKPVLVENKSLTERVQQFFKHSSNHEFYSHVFRAKTWWELLLICAIMCGIEICYSAETAFVSPLLLSLGIDMSYMTLVWCISPILGFVLTPILGSLSDTCKSTLGRRRPFILLYSIGIVLGLVLLPNGKTIGIAMGDTTTKNPCGILFTIIGTVFMDFCCDACQSPARAYVLDVTTPKDHTRALSYFSIMAGVGGFIGAVISATDWKNSFLSYYVKDELKLVFLIILILFLILLTTTIFSFREIPLNLVNLVDVTSSAQSTQLVEVKTANNSETNDGNKDKTDSARIDPKSTLEETEEVADVHLTIGEYLKSILNMPSSMWILSLTHLISWMAFLCYALYFTEFVGESVFGGNPKGDEASKKLYMEGVQFGCWGVAVFCLTCALYSLFVIERLVDKIGAWWTYSLGLLVNGLGTFAIVAIKTKFAVVVLSATVGVLYSTMFTVPYVMVAHYHQVDSEYKGKRGLGTDIGIISTMVFVGQFILSSGLGTLVTVIGSSDTIMYLSTLFSFMGMISAYFVTYHKL